jgi:hypothetical protein
MQSVVAADVILTPPVRPVGLAIGGVISPRSFRSQRLDRRNKSPDYS